MLVSNWMWLFCCLLFSFFSHTHVVVSKVVDMEYPEENDPLFIYSFDKIRINNKKKFANGLNIQTCGHIQDVFADRFKLNICGDADDEILIEMPRVPYQLLKEEKQQKKASKQCGAFDNEIYDHESKDKTVLLADKARHQKYYHLKFNSGEGGPLRDFNSSPGSEADYKVTSHTVTHKPRKNDYPVTTTLIKWKLLFTDSIETIKQPKTAAETKGKSKFEEMEEGMDNLVIAESQSEG